MKFSSLGIDVSMVNKLKTIGIETPTPIQLQTLPAAMAGKDVVGRSPTGTGKTLAYLLPVIAAIDTNYRENQALILAPTYELVIQIQRQIEILIADTDIKSLPLVGNANIIRQIEKLRDKPHIVVGSPGRVWELIQKRKLSANSIKILALDEADSLLGEQLNTVVQSIVKSTKKERQTLLFSATITPRTLTTAQIMLNNPLLLVANERPKVAGKILHNYFVCDRRDKFDTLRKLVHSVGLKQGLVFINNSDDVEKLTARLNFHSLKAVGMHGSFSQAQRKEALTDFRAGRCLLLVASDLAARGLDVRGVDYVYNLDLPDSADDYLHRVGRTGRAGEPGFAFSIATPNEIDLLKKYEVSLGIKIEEKTLREGKIRDVGMRKKGS